MKAIILAAGRGRRLFGDDAQIPKCLVPIGSATLIEHGIGNLREGGFHEITVVVGFAGQRVRQVCGPNVLYVENLRFKETDSLYSLWLARTSLRDGAVILNGDVLFHPQLLAKLVNASSEDALVVDDTRPRGQFGAEETKVKLFEGSVCRIGKDLALPDIDGENVGIAKFSRSGARVLLDVLEARVGAGESDHPLPRALQDFAERRPLAVVSTDGLPWIEIDFPEDYQQALDHILPMIEARRPSQTTSPPLRNSGQAG